MKIDGKLVEIKPKFRADFKFQAKFKRRLIRIFQPGLKFQVKQSKAKL